MWVINNKIYLLVRFTTVTPSLARAKRQIDAPNSYNMELWNVLTQ